MVRRLMLVAMTLAECFIQTIAADDVCMGGTSNSSCGLTMVQRVALKELAVSVSARQTPTVYGGSDRMNTTAALLTCEMYGEPHLKNFQGQLPGFGGYKSWLMQKRRGAYPLFETPDGSVKAQVWMMGPKMSNRVGGVAIKIGAVILSTVSGQPVDVDDPDGEYVDPSFVANHKYNIPADGEAHQFEGGVVVIGIKKNANQWEWYVDCIEQGVAVKFIQYKWSKRPAYYALEVTVPADMITYGNDLGMCQVCSSPSEFCGEGCNWENSAYYAGSRVDIPKPVNNSDLFFGKKEHYHLCQYTTSGYDASTLMGQDGCATHAELEKFVYKPMEWWTFKGNFSNCGATGSEGPTDKECQVANGNNKYFAVPKQGYQLYTIPQGGMYDITVAGAKGGGHGEGIGGFGAKLEASAEFAANDMLLIVVGQQGWTNPNNYDWGGAGGGGSFVAKVVEPPSGVAVEDLPYNVVPLFIAGGGAGVQDRVNSGQSEGGLATEGDPDSPAEGNWAGGGGGWLHSGSGSTSGGKSFVNGAKGGRPGNTHYGGFGGGGGPYNGAGGGGGYDGGDCNIGGTDHDCHGGSSYGPGASITPNQNDGDGYVNIIPQIPFEKPTEDRTQVWCNEFQIPFERATAACQAVWDQEQAFNSKYAAHPAPTLSYYEACLYDFCATGGEEQAAEDDLDFVDEVDPTINCSSGTAQECEDAAEGVCRTSRTLAMTPCFATGASGPTQEACDGAYGSGQVEVVENGYQIFTVPKKGDYHITAYGAKGGDHGAGIGGFGAEASGWFTLQPDDKLLVVVGQMGWTNPSTGDWGGGGGGATFVAKKSDDGTLYAGLPFGIEMLLVAGGGAGVNDRVNSGQSEGGLDVEGDPSTAADGGSSGGGGGWLHNGASTSGGKSFVNGAKGGRPGNTHYGGFGGGGGPYNGAGGGGGYDGGDCNIGGTDHDCHGGSSFGPELRANVNNNPGYVDIQRAPSHTRLELADFARDDSLQSVRFSNVAQYKGMTLDLLVKPDSGDLKDIKKAGEGPWGQVRIDCHTEINFEFSFVDADTGAPVTLDGFVFSVVDLDTKAGQIGTEKLTVCGSTVFLASNTELRHTVDDNGCDIVEATTEGSGEDNPRSEILSKEQAKRAVDFNFENVDSFNVKMNTGDCNNRRNILFSGVPTVSCSLLPPMPPIHLTTTTTTMPPIPHCYAQCGTSTYDLCVDGVQVSPL